MQLITLASVAALAATASATSAAASFNNNATCIDSEPKVRVFNRCPYKVHLWSVFKGQGCPSEDGAVLETGDFYQENYRKPSDGVGVSIKISKESRCKGIDCLQLEYYLEEGSSGGAYDYNYLDVSYVDCTGGDCPTKSEGYYLKSGNQNGEFLKNALNQICPILSCSNAEECATMSYILPDDVQTKSCDLKADLDFYMCGGEAPGDESSDTPAASSSSSPSPSSSAEESSSTPAPSSTSEEAESSTEAPAYTALDLEVAAAEVTSAPAVPSNIKTEVVYVTKFEYVNAKRHAHGHRHQHFRA